MTKEEFILGRLRDERTVYRVLFVGCAIATACGIALCIAMLVMGGIAEALMVACLVATLAGYAAASRATFKGLDSAVREIEQDPEGLSYPEDYSVSTFTRIERIQRPAKEYRAKLIAYGLVAITMIGTSALVLPMMDGEIVLIALLLFMLVMGLGMAALAFQSYRDWRNAKRFDSYRAADE